MISEGVDNRSKLTSGNANLLFLFLKLLTIYALTKRVRHLASEVRNRTSLSTSLCRLVSSNLVEKLVFDHLGHEAMDCFNGRLRTGI